MRDAYWKHISNIFTFENDSSDPDTPKPEKIKKSWSFIKSLKKDAYGITSLRENGILKTDSKEKANICNRPFQSAFTREDDSDLHSKGASPFSSMGDITVDPKGVAKLLDGLNVHKASGLDGLNARVLKEQGFTPKLNVRGSLGLNFEYDRGLIIEIGGPIFLYKLRILEGSTSFREGSVLSPTQKF